MNKLEIDNKYVLIMNVMISPKYTFFKSHIEYRN